MSNKISDEIILYDHDGSPCSRRVKITLIEKGIPFSIQKVDLGKMQQKTPEYLAINPNGLVPTLSHNGRILYESSVINDYLEDQFPNIRLSPKTAQGKVAAQQWQNHELAMAKLYRPLMYSRIMGPLYHIACTKQEFMKIAAQATNNPAHLAWEEKIYDLKVLSPDQQAEYQRKIIQFANHVERALEGKRYLVEDQFSVADISVYPRLSMFVNAGIPLGEYEYPNIHHWMGELSQRHSFKSSISPSNESVAKLSKLGIIRSINRVVYDTYRASLKDKVITKMFRPIFRKVLDIDTSLQNNPAPPIKQTPSPVRRHILGTSENPHVACI